MEVFKAIYFLFVLMVFCIPSKGQVTDTIRISQSDSAQIELLKKVPDDVIVLEILKIQGQIIENLSYMMDYLHKDQKRMEIKLDSVLNVMLSEKKNSLKKQK